MKRRVYLWTLVVALLIGIGMSGFYFFVQNIKNDEEQLQQARLNYAYKHMNVKEVTDAFTYVADKSYTIIRAKDEKQEKLIIWLARGFVHHVYERDAMSVEQIKGLFEQDVAQANILRIRPGIFDGIFVWEVYYERNQESDDAKHGYLYYDIKSGEKITEIQL